MSTRHTRWLRRQASLSYWWHQSLQDRPGDWDVRPVCLTGGIKVYKTDQVIETSGQSVLLVASKSTRQTRWLRRQASLSYWWHQSLHDRPGDWDVRPVCLTGGIKVYKTDQVIETSGQSVLLVASKSTRQTRWLRRQASLSYRWHQSLHDRPGDWDVRPVCLTGGIKVYTTDQVIETSGQSVLLVASKSTRQTRWLRRQASLSYWWHQSLHDRPGDWDVRQVCLTGGIKVYKTHQVIETSGQSVLLVASKSTRQTRWLRRQASLSYWWHQSLHDRPGDWDVRPVCLTGGIKVYTTDQVIETSGKSVLLVASKSTRQTRWLRRQASLSYWWHQSLHDRPGDWDVRPVCLTGGIKVYTADQVIETSGQSVLLVASKSTRQTRWLRRQASLSYWWHQSLQDRPGDWDVRPVCLTGGIKVYTTDQVIETSGKSVLQVASKSTRHTRWLRRQTSLSYWWHKCLQDTPGDWDVRQVCLTGGIKVYKSDQVIETSGQSVLLVASKSTRQTRWLRRQASLSYRWHQSLQDTPGDWDVRQVCLTGGIKVYTTDQVIETSGKSVLQVASKSTRHTRWLRRQASLSYWWHKCLQDTPGDWDVRPVCLTGGIKVYKTDQVIETSGQSVLQVASKSTRHTRWLRRQTSLSYWWHKCLQDTPGDWDVRPVCLTGGIKVYMTDQVIETSGKSVLLVASKSTRHTRWLRCQASLSYWWHKCLQDTPGDWDVRQVCLTGGIKVYKTDHVIETSGQSVLLVALKSTRQTMWLRRQASLSYWWHQSLQDRPGDWDVRPVCLTGGIKVYKTHQVIETSGKSVLQVASKSTRQTMWLRRQASLSYWWHQSLQDTPGDWDVRPVCLTGGIKVYKTHQVIETSGQSVLLVASKSTRHTRWLRRQASLSYWWHQSLHDRPGDWDVRQVCLTGGIKVYTTDQVIETSDKSVLLVALKSTRHTRWLRRQASLSYWWHQSLQDTPGDWDVRQVCLTGGIKFYKTDQVIETSGKSVLLVASKSTRQTRWLRRQTSLSYWWHQSLHDRPGDWDVRPVCLTGGIKVYKTDQVIETSGKSVLLVASKSTRQTRWLRRQASLSYWWHQSLQDTPGDWDVRPVCLTGGIKVYTTDQVIETSGQSVLLVASKSTRQTRWLRRQTSLSYWWHQSLQDRPGDWDVRQVCLTGGIKVYTTDQVIETSDKSVLLVASKSTRQTRWLRRQTSLSYWWHQSLQDRPGDWDVRQVCLTGGIKVYMTDQVIETSDKSVLLVASKSTWQTRWLRRQASLSYWWHQSLHERPGDWDVRQVCLTGGIKVYKTDQVIETSGQSVLLVASKSTWETRWLRRQISVRHNRDHHRKYVIFYNTYSKSTPWIMDPGYIFYERSVLYNTCRIWTPIAP